MTFGFSTCVGQSVRKTLLRHLGLSPWVVLGLAVLLFTAYLTTLAPSVTWSHWGIDTGELALAAERWIVVHPPGYPLYLLVAKLFTLLPFGEIAYRTNLMSAVFGVLTVLAAAWSLSLAVRGWVSSPSAQKAAILAGAGTLAFAPTFWSQAVITEVYTLHTFLLALMVGLMLRWRESVREGLDGRRWLMGTAFAFGLGMANHTTMAMAFPGLVLFVAFHHPSLRGHDGFHGIRINHPWRLLRDFAISAVTAAAPLSLYLLVMFWARQGTWPSLWDPATPEALVDHVMGGPFRSFVMAMPAEWTRSRISALPRLLLEEFGYVGFALAMTGIWVMLHRDLLLFLFGALISAFAIPFAVSYPVYDSQVYLLPVFLSLAMAIGWGVALVLGLIETHRPQLVAGRHNVVLAIVLLLPLSAYLGNRPNIDISQDRAAYSQMLTALETVPPGGALVCAGPPELFVLWYLQYTQGHRQDVLVIDGFASRGGSYQTNLTRQFAGQVPPPGTPAYLQAFIRQSAQTRDVYATAKAKDYVSGFPYKEQDNGMLRVEPSRASTRMP